jgi:acyl dehydratase
MNLSTLVASPQHRLHWEDFVIGSVHESGTITVSRDEIVDFARCFDPQPFHLDEAAAAETHFGGLVASGWHTASLAMRLIWDSYLHRAESLGSPGIDKLRWTAPVRPGDTLRLRMTVLGARPMRSKPHIGLMESRWEMFNQRDELVLDMSGWGMFGRRTPEATAAD